MGITKSKIDITFGAKPFEKACGYCVKNLLTLIVIVISVFSLFFFYYYYQNGVGIAYNDARSHLDIGRRVVENLKPGLAQLGSVWLPLPHILMIPTIWNDFFWHSGLSGALVSMISFVCLGVLVYRYLENVGVSAFGRVIGILVLLANINILYLQSTAMTEMLLLLTMTTGCYYLMRWAAYKKIINLLKAAFWIMLSTLVRYDGWFLLLFSAIIVTYIIFRRRGYKETEGTIVLYLTLGTVGIFLWLIWNLLIFGDPLYFIFGPFSAHTQQQQIFEAGELFTKNNLHLSIKAYLYALFYNSYTVPALFGFLGFVLFWRDKNIKRDIRTSGFALISPFIFNVVALYLGHSVLFVKGVVFDSWFNVRYGMMLIPSLAIYIGYLVDRLKEYRWIIVGLNALVISVAFVNGDSVTIDDALVGSSGKNVAEVSGWLQENVADKDGYVLISVASHDAIIFSSSLPMKRFIHEGTGAYWDYAVENPDQWTRWIVMRTHDLNDMTFAEIQDAEGFTYYELVDHYPFADIYQLKDGYLGNLNPVLPAEAKLK